MNISQNAEWDVFVIFKDPPPKKSLVRVYLGSGTQAAQAISIWSVRGRRKRSRRSELRHLLHFHLHQVSPDWTLTESLASRLLFHFIHVRRYSSTKAFKHVKFCVVRLQSLDSIVTAKPHTQTHTQHTRTQGSPVAMATSIHYIIGACGCVCAWVCGSVCVHARAGVCVHVSPTEVDGDST